MFPHPRRVLAAFVLLTLATLGLVTALLYAQPHSSPVVVAKLTSFTGTSEKGSLDEALTAALRSAAAVAPSGRATSWKVTRISGLSGGANPPSRIVVTVEAHW